MLPATGPATSLKLGSRTSEARANRESGRVDKFHIISLQFPDLPDFLIFRTSLGDFTPDGLDSRSLQTLWEWKNRVLLEEYYIFNVAIPLEVE